MNFLTESGGYLTKRKIRAMMRRYDLTKREINIMGLIGLELSDSEIAEFIHLTPVSVRKINQTIREKIGAKTRVGIAVFIAKKGLV